MLILGDLRVGRCRQQHHHRGRAQHSHDALLMRRSTLPFRKDTTGQTAPPSTPTIAFWSTRVNALKSGRTCRISAIASNRPRSDRIWCSRRVRAPWRSRLISIAAGAYQRPLPEAPDHGPQVRHFQAMAAAFDQSPAPVFPSPQWPLQCADNNNGRGTGVHATTATSGRIWHRGRKARAWRGLCAMGNGSQSVDRGF